MVALALWLAGFSTRVPGGNGSGREGRADGSSRTPIKRLNVSRWSGTRRSDARGGIGALG